MDWSVIYDFRVLLIRGFFVTVELSVLAIVLGSLLGFIVSLGQTGRYKWLRVVGTVYIQIFRGSPLLMQLFMFYFGLPYLGQILKYTAPDVALILLSLSPFTTAVLVFTLYSGAYIAEIFRSGYQSIPKGQFEAASAIGLNYFRMIQKVILPQMMKLVYPPLVGFYIGLIKDTSLTSIIGYQELVKQGQSIINTTSKPFEVYLTISLLYFILCYPLSLLVARAERRQIHD